MFDRTYIRGWIALAWLVVFVSFWVLMQYFLLDKKDLVEDLDKLEKSIVKEDWVKASEEIKSLEKDWKRQQLFVQINNGEATVSTFSERLDQTKVLVEHQEDDALSTIGELKSLAKSVAVAFPGP